MIVLPMHADDEFPMSTDGGPMPLYATRDGSDERGFTLVEMLMAIVVAGLLGAAMFGLFLDQNRFYGETDDRLSAKQTLRSSAELVESELRGAAGGDVLAAEPDSIAIWHDEINGYVCELTAGGVVYYYVHDRTADPGLLNLLGSRGTAYQDPFTTTYQYDPDFDATGSAASLARDACEAAGAPTTGDDADYRAVSWSASIPAPQAGATLRLYRKLAYHFAPSDFGEGTALWRNEQELAGPFDDGASSFRYRVCTGGSCSWFTSVSDKSDQRNITRVEVSARALGDGTNRHDVAVDLDYDIGLRN